MKSLWLRMLLIAFPLAGGVLGYLSGPAMARLRLEVRRGDLEWERILDADDDEPTLEMAVQRQAISRDRLDEEARRAERPFILGGALFGLWCGLVVSARMWRLRQTPERLEFETHPGDCLACTRCFLRCPRERLRRRRIAEAEGADVPAPGAGWAERLRGWGGERLQWAAASVGVASLLFCAFVAVFLVSEAVAAGSEKPPEDPHFETLIARYESGEDDENLREEIRAADVRRRADILRRQEFFQRGAWLLMFGAVLAVAGFSAWASLRPKHVAVPDLDPEAKDHEARQRNAAATGTAVVGGLLLAALLAAALWGRTLREAAAPARAPQTDAPEALQEAAPAPSPGPDDEAQ